MKTLKIFIIILALSVSAAKAQFIKAELQVSGLTCSMCSKATEKSLRALDFIGDIKPDLNRNLFLITFKNNTPVNLEQISKKVQGAGFSVNSLKATVNFDNIKVVNNSFNYAGDTYVLVNNTGNQLNGQQSITVVDKGFAPANIYKKYQGTSPGNAAGKTYHIVI
jgi:copper chaperone CopZ